MSTCPNITNKILHIKLSTPFIFKMKESLILRFIANANSTYNVGTTKLYQKILLSPTTFLLTTESKFLQFAKFEIRETN